MNIQQMKYVVAIANNGSFREAAKKLFVAQPSLSHAVKELEEELSTKLFERTNKGATLTEEGLEFMHYAQKILTQFERMEHRYSNVEKKNVHFSISAQHYDFLAVVISQLLKEETDYRSFRIFESTTQKIIEDVAEFRSELGIIFLNDQNSVAIGRVLQEENLTYETLVSFSTHIFLGTHHPLANHEEIEEWELREYPQVRFTQEANNYSYFQEDLIDMSEEDRVIHTTDRATLTGILQRTNAYGTGSGLVETPEIKLIPLKNSPINRISVIHPKNKPLSDIARKFVSVLRDYFKEYETSL
ncbi:DNA-binding transcriptional regulator, LysR family [Pilibacter termitis]|uniref:DNA-binding transcriptional regulator, LysR family n=1 Tax=Pilibacter termitis TaxID=263852 RepID=A0A1T4NA43_9ENTE|nr:LysR family transcriptional regulator [Pilibacter termitis]SJZ75937.1 DNA-binding transcriptional regulator, LysR family [Pilibacter termitis]